MRPGGRRLFTSHQPRRAFVLEFYPSSAPQVAHLLIDHGAGMTVVSFLRQPLCDTSTRSIPPEDFRPSPSVIVPRLISQMLPVSTKLVRLAVPAHGPRPRRDKSSTSPLFSGASSGSNSCS